MDAHCIKLQWFRNDTNIENSNFVQSTPIIKHNSSQPYFEQTLSVNHYKIKSPIDQNSIIATVFPSFEQNSYFLLLDFSNNHFKQKLTFNSVNHKFSQPKNWFQIFSGDKIYFNDFYGVFKRHHKIRTEPHTKPPYRTTLPKYIPNHTEYHRTKQRAQ